MTEGVDGTVQDADDIQADPRGEAEAQVVSEQGEQINPAVSLEEQLQQARDEAAANYDKFLRARADMENYKRRVERDYADLRRSSKREVLGKLLTVKDNLERALHYGEAAGANNESIVEGVRLTQYQLDTVLQGEGVQPIEAEGKIFDPHLEEAVHRVNDPSVPDHTVVQVVRPGYTFGDDVLRPAQVSSACMETTISSDSARGLDHLAEGVGDSSDAVFGAFSLRRKASALTGIHLDSLTISNP